MKCIVLWKIKPVPKHTHLSLQNHMEAFWDTIIPVVLLLARASPVAQKVKNPPAMWEAWVGRSPGGGHGNPLQYSSLENPCGQRSLVGYSPRGRKESDRLRTDWGLSTTTGKASAFPFEFVSKSLWQDVSDGKFLSFEGIFLFVWKVQKLFRTNPCDEVWWVEDGSPDTWLSYFGVKMFHEYKVRGLIFFSRE